MSKARPRAPATSVLILIASLTGCATSEKCGVEGCSSDREITANVRAALDQHPGLGPPDSITVQTSNHVVYLSGHVSEGLMRSTAVSLARDVKGVTRVEDTIYVTK
jgi:osmotically-inducible protein OsmY